MKIKVTTDDIKNGEPGQYDECAISKALKKNLKGEHAFTECDFDSGKITLNVDGTEYKIKSYDRYKVGDFIDRFDNDDEPKPIQFEIEEK